LLLADVIIVHHEPRPDGSRQMPEVGFVIPAHASALGKALLAFRPDDAHALLSSERLRSMTGETIVDPTQLPAHLADLARIAVAVSAFRWAALHERTERAVGRLTRLRWPARHRVWLPSWSAGTRPPPLPGRR